jgi:hydroxybutyrate-dimer hydrolase
MTLHRVPFRFGVLASAAILVACGGAVEPIELNTKPTYIGFIDEKAYDGTTDDLLTAGLGRTGLAGAAPAVSATPTAAELRRLAIHTNYRAIVDVSPNGGYGRLFGPNVALDGTVGAGEGRIAGREYITYADDGTGSQNVTLMVQVPNSFDTARPCIVTGTSSGSRGIYGAIGSSGEWGLKRGCAVAYADKGTGNGVHDLQSDTVHLIDGTRTTATNAGKASNFTARLTAAERASLNALTPNRVAVKHAHSEQNPEKDWGRDTLRAVEFAFWVLNERYSPELSTGGRERRIRPQNTVVIASSVSNGGGAALAAAEIDRSGLIDGVAVSEPQVQLQTLPTGTLRIQRGTQPPLPVTSRTLIDYFTYANLLQPCAALAAGAAGSPFGFTAGFNLVAATNRCTALAANRLVSGTSTAEQAADALNKLLTYGWEAESNPLHASHYLFATPAIAVTYSNAYGRFRVTDNLCGYSIGFFVATDPAQAPVAVPSATLATLFATGNGVPPGAGLQLINNTSSGGARGHAVGVSASTGLADFSFDNAVCQRDLWTGSSASAGRVRSGTQEVLRTANLGGKPAIIVHGRADTLVPANFSSRPYFARNLQVEGANSRLRYIEVTNAQHFDSFLAFPGYDTRYVPLHIYFNRAMDAMWAHLTAGAPLPDSQVVRTTPRGGTAGAAPALGASNVPPIAAAAAAADAIKLLNGDTLFVPD